MLFWRKRNVVGGCVDACFGERIKGETTQLLPDTTETSKLHYKVLMELL